MQPPSSKSASILAALACLAALAAIALAAAGAHVDASPLLATAAGVLTPNAVGALALALGAERFGSKGLWIAGALVLAGASVFAGDMAARVFLDHRLFPMAAPVGGVTMMLGWIVGAGAFVARALGAGGAR